MTFGVDHDRSACGTQEFGECQPEGDQQDVVDAGMESCWNLAEQHPGGLGIQLHRQTAGIGIGVDGGLNRGQRRRDRRDVSPALQFAENLRAVGVFGQYRRPPCERGPRRWQRDVLPAVMLGPRKVEVLQQNSPRHTVDDQVVRDDKQLPPRGHCPQSADHPAGSRVQP